MAEANPIRFSTQYADDVTGDVKYLYRDYTSRMGRWGSRDPIGERGGRNLYGFAYNDGVNAIDLLGLVIECKCPEAYFRANGITPKMYTKSGNSYSAKPGLAATSFDGQGAPEVLWKMLVTKANFKASQINVEELKRHVQARLTIVNNARRAAFSWRADDNKRDVLNHTNPNRPDFGSDPAGFFESINNAGTELRCKHATVYVFESGNLLKGYGVRPNDLIFIPGDWPYLDNEAQTKEPREWDRGLEGENLIHVGGADFWGHPDGVHTEKWWRDTITDWKSKTGKPGIPKWGSHTDSETPIIKYPGIGLDR